MQVSRFLPLVVIKHLGRRSTAGAAGMRKNLRGLQQAKGEGSSRQLYHTADDGAQFYYNMLCCCQLKKFMHISRTPQDQVERRSSKQ